MTPENHDNKATESAPHDETVYVYYNKKHHTLINNFFYEPYYFQIRLKADKRKMHYCDRKIFGQMTLGDAVTAMRESTHSRNPIKEDCSYATKKPRLKPEEMESIITSPDKTFWGYTARHTLFGPVKQRANTMHPPIG